MSLTQTGLSSPAGSGTFDKLPGYLQEQMYNNDKKKKIV